MNLNYQNQAMSRDEAFDIATDLGRLLSRTNADGQALPGTTRVGLTQRGDGFDVRIPAEHAAQIAAWLTARKRKNLESERGG